MRILIVDDEPWARRRIAALLEAVDDVEVVGECASGAEAVAAIQEQAPDLVFLDVQMPEVDGFDVLQAVGADRMPLVVRLKPSGAILHCLGLEVEGGGCRQDRFVVDVGNGRHIGRTGFPNRG